MASKYQMINAAYKAEIAGFAENENFWKGLLRTAGNNYKYSFTEQVCIFLQKPEATACAEIGFWNDKIGRWVNKGAKGIALIENNGEKHYLKYVFDVSDTNSRQGYEAPIWSVKQNDYDDIIDSLEGGFGELADKTNFISAIKSAASNLVEDNYIDYLPDIVSYKDDTYFANLDIAETEKLFKMLLTNSVSYMMLSRCGIEPEGNLEVTDFKAIYFFNSEKIMTILGSSMSDISEMGLREIESTVRSLRLNEKNANRTFVNTPEQVYDEVVKEITTERNENYVTDNNRVHEAWRLFNPELDLAPTEEISATGQIRNAEENIPQGTSQSDLRNSNDGQRVDETPSRSGYTGERDAVEVDDRDGTDTRDNRADEIRKSNALGSVNEQHQELGGGNRTARTDLQLSNHDWDKGGGIPYYYGPDEKNELLRTCDRLKDNRVEIATFFAENKSRDERGNFVKQYFDNTPTEQVLESGQLVSYRAYDDCLHIWRGNSSNPEKEDFMKWWSVADSIYGMILLEAWLEPHEPMLLSEEAQVSFISDRQGEKGKRFTIPQAAVDYVVPGGGKEFKCSVFDAVKNNTGTDDLAKILREHHGIGGRTDAIPGSGYNESHDGKGIEISRGLRGDEKYESVLIPWNKVAKRITELVQLDRYLTESEKFYFPTYKQERELREERNAISNEYISIIRDYNHFQDSLGNDTAKLNAYEYISVANRFVWGERKDYIFATNDNVLVLPKMREAMGKIIAENTHLTERCQSVLEQLNGNIAKPFEPTEQELNPPPETPKEYQLSLGDKVYIGAADYDIIFLGDDEVRLFDNEFPIFNKVMTREEFDTKIKENPLNDKYLVETQLNENPPAHTITESDNEIPEIIRSALKEFYSSNFPDEEYGINDENLSNISLAYSSTGDGNHEIEVRLNLNEYKFNFLIDGNPLTTIVCFDVNDVAEHLYSFEFDSLIAFAEEEYQKQFTVIHNNPENPLQKPIGRIDYLSMKGTVQESIEFTDADRLQKVIEDNNNYGVPMEVVLYEDENGNTVPHEYIYSCDPPLQGFSIESNIEKVPIVDRTPENETNAEAIENVENNSDIVAEPILEAPKITRQRNIPPTILYPDIQSSYRTNFNIENDAIGEGTPLERYQNNNTAIRLLKKLESEHRLADTNEQRVLSEYVGWGGLSDFFNETNAHYLELKELLTEEEYAAARESTLTAFYTPPVVIRSIYEALANMNFKEGNILEPSCGVGNFLGLLPNEMNSSKFYGIELDSTSGRIAQQLYQNSSIAVQGFEKTNLPDSFFDLAIGNVPFGDFKIPDRRYDKNNFLIHDYFFARTIDKVRPGGVIAFVTSKGTLDKENPAVRKYISQRCELLGAIRLPNDTFTKAAGTEVTSDIIFLQKRDRLVDIDEPWVHLAADDNGIRINSYFVENPEMVLGDMKMISGQYGPTPACVPYDNADLGELLKDAIQNIHAEFTEYELDELAEEETDNSIPADPNVRNFSYTVMDGKIYYRENSRMNLVDVSATAENRIKGLINIRDSVRNLIELQTEDYPDSEIQAEQAKLNRLYDEFSKKYGLINSRANNSSFGSDSSYCLLSSLEVIDDDGNFIRKADIFSKRTIKQKLIVHSVDTASEALALSLAEKTKVDIEYMMKLTDKTEEEVFSDLKGVIFLNPMHTNENDGEERYLPADEYLSGNVREKLILARRTAELYPDDYTANVKALEAVQPIDLSASEISIRLGATWLPPEIVEQFMFELFGTARYMQWNIHVHFSKYTGEWNIEGKSYDRSNIKSSNTYGTTRINGYKIMEETLNLRDVRIFDYPEDENGNKHAVLNKKETAIAQGKQELIKEAFAEWIWSDPERRDKLCKMYNEKFNSNRPREYDGSHLNFVGINPEINLRKHQVDAIAHIIYGGNTLLAHEVGAGKTFEMVAAAQESKRLGLCQKSLFVVPNHLISQWSSEYLQLYPSANILVASKKDFETKNRKKFCGRIATGDYDAIIIGHSQFEKIPMSIERQRMILQQQMDEVIEGISEMKANRGDKFSIKQLEKTKKTVAVKLDKLNDQSRKDDLVTFEELGIDRIFIDESHYYKNLAAFTKMRNVGGIAQTEAQKSSDLYMKCRYLDELTGGRGVVFATGTPISNSMVEMYTMQKYLQYSELKQNDLLHFDSWASTFGQTVTAIELSPEGSGYRARTRFAKFYNLPELMSMFKEVADIQTADMLKLPVPEAHFHNVVLKPSEHQKSLVESLSDRAERVRNKMVNSSTDNMLLITNDGRKLALDQRLINDMLPDDENSKVAICAKNVFDIWQRTTLKKSSQMVFCDLSTPHNDGKFNVYDDLRKKLIDKGIPENEIAFIHNANSEAQKKELFGKVRNGQIRVLIGSTSKMGSGTNAQKRLCALHHLDTPWRPADLAQRNGRIIRQGNNNKEVDIFTYVTENTFDSYLYQLVENKQKFIGQIMTSKSPVRSAEDVDEQALSYAEIKMLATGNPHIKEKMDLDIDVSKLKLLKANNLSQKYALEDKIIKDLPLRISTLEQRIDGYKADIEMAPNNTHTNEDGFSPMTVDGTYYTEKKDAGFAILAACKAMKNPEPILLGEYRGFKMELCFERLSREYIVTLIGKLRHNVPLGTDIYGNIQRLDNAITGMEEKLISCKEQLENAKVQLENAKVEVEKPFSREEELKQKTARLSELNSMLNLDKNENDIVDDEREEAAEEPERKEKGRDSR